MKIIHIRTYRIFNSKAENLFFFNPIKSDSKINIILTLILYLINQFLGINYV
jgi:hypothetical protein